jgi:hypothetical protein
MSLSEYTSTLCKLPKGKGFDILTLDGILIVLFRGENP